MALDRSDGYTICILPYQEDSEDTARQGVIGKLTMSEKDGVESRD